MIKDVRMKKALVITSIAKDTNPILQQYAKLAIEKEIAFYVAGDLKSPNDFAIKGCTFLSIADQNALGFELSQALPVHSYSRKNIAYLASMRDGASIIIETDDDNSPLDDFWEDKPALHQASQLTNCGWVNVYKYFSDLAIWPRGFPLERIAHTNPQLPEPTPTFSPILQGLADGDPDVDAIFRLTNPRVVNFLKRAPVALGKNTICPFNSQNTTWHQEAFCLMYLPSYCNFRMTDIWRSFIAQRIAWTCNWSISFHQSTVYQERNAHNLLHDFEDEIPGYLHNDQIFELLKSLPLKAGIEYLQDNLKQCYAALVAKKLIGELEIDLLDLWLSDINHL
jgi:hypothetical protein